jgi:hypothetical protein
MDFQLYFCADGILRAKLNDNKPMIPLKFLQENSSTKDNDFRFWARWWESSTYFESGLTVGKFLSCLEPWGEFWSDFTGKDVVEYIKESRRPTVVKDNEDGEDPLSWVGLSYYTEVNPSIEYGDEDSIENMLEDLDDWFNRAKKTRLTGEWEMYGSYKLSGYVEGKDEQYSIDYTPMNKLANLPFILNDKQVLYFCNWKMPQILGEGKEHFFKEDAFGLCKTKDGFTQFLIGEKYHNIRDIVEGFFWWFHATPTSRNDFMEDLLSRKMVYEDSIEIDLDEEEEKESNVVSLFGKEIEYPEDAVENTESDKKKVVVASNAFSPIVEKLSRESQYWEDMLEIASKENEVVLKIGKTEEAKVPEKRIFGHIIKDDADPANPKPSDYKMW